MPAQSPWQPYCGAEFHGPVAGKPVICDLEAHDSYVMHRTSETGCRARCAAGETQLDLAVEFRVSKPTMHKAIVGKTWKHVA